MPPIHTYIYTHIYNVYKYIYIYVYNIYIYINISEGKLGVGACYGKNEVSEDNVIIYIYIYIYMNYIGIYMYIYQNDK